MTILQQPDVLSLSGNIAPFRINSASPVLFTLRQGSEEILSHRYAPGQDGYITIDIRDIVHARLSFLLQESSTVYVQPSLAATFTAVIDGTEVNFRVVRAGVDRLTDTTSNFLTQNFLSWQPSVKPVTYYSPEFLTYYAILPCKAKLRAYFTDSSGNMISQQDLELYTFASGNAYTIPLQYAIVAGRLGHKLPAYYDVWIENNSSERLTYIQRYYASDMRSEQEQWILFENSLGGIDTFRAYGTTDFTGEHTHNIAEVEDIAFEYRVDTERKFQKNTGHLNRKERQWLLDFFPSEVKYIYSGSALRRIVVVESNVTYTDRELPSHYTFTYRYADARPLLNLPRTDIPTEVLNITVPEVGSFTVPPRLVEFSRLPLTEGALFPVQQPYSEEWNTTTAGALEEYISNRIYEKYNAAWSKQIYLIRRNDKTPPTEENAYSALEADNRFLTKEEVPDSYFTKKRSPDGQEYLHTNYPLVLERYAVFGHGDTPYLPSMFEEIPLDQQTLGWKDGVITVLGGGGSDFDELAMWGVLGKEGVQQIDKSHLSGALAGYTTEKFVTDKGYITSSALTGYATETFVRENFVTLAGAQEITGEKDFTGGLKVNGGLLDYDPTERVWKLNGNMLISGNITFGWDNGTYTAPTLLDLLPYDPATLSKEGGRLSVIGSAGSSFDESAMWTALLKSGSQQIDKSHLGTALAGYATENFVNTNLNALKGAGLPTTEGYRNVTEIANTLLTFLTGSDTDSTINKWKELEAFLAGFSETDTLATALSVKADKTRSIIAGIGLSGGGDLSADRTLSLSPSGIKAGTYTKLTVDAYGRATSASGLIASDIPTLEISKINGLQDRLNTFVTLADAQEITGEKNFTGGLKVNGGLLDYDPTHKVWKLDGNLLITGSTTWNAVGDYTAPTLLDLLPYDPATLSKEGGKLTVIGGGSGSNTGSISLNGQRYDSVDGVITLPVASNNKALNEGIVYTKSDGITEIGNKLDFHDPNTTNQDYDYRLQQIYDNGAVLVGSSKFRATEFQKVGGTASQFLKADGSVDSNLYALSYNGNQNKVEFSRYVDYVKVVDRRNEVITPNSVENSSVNAYFSMQGTPTNQWYSVLTLKGWSNDYGVWQLAGPSSTNNTNSRPYYRDGRITTWNAWKPIAFLEDISNLGDVYFNGQNIYVDYGYWVVGLVRIGTAGIGDKFISGEMIYRRSNGIYGNGSVRFNLIKQYNSTKCIAGVFYTGYGIDPDQEAPRLCTFTYQGVKWGGLCWKSAASLNSIKTIIYDNSSTDTPFYVLYYNSQSSSVINAEINNSISVLGSDIDVQPVSTNGRIYTSADRLEINNISNGWAYTRYRSNGRFYDTGLSGTTGGLVGLVGNYEIRPTGSNNEGIFVRYSQSDYGKLGVVNRSGQQCSIGYFNSNTGFGDKPIWTVGAGLRDSRSFDWWYGTEGYKMTLMEDGRLFVNRKSGDAPSYSLSIGDNDTGLNWVSDGRIKFMANSRDIGGWDSSVANLHECVFRSPTNNDYNGLSLMINGNGTANSIKPGIGFHQPGVYAGSIKLDAAGSWMFCVQGGTVGGTVQAGSFWANGGWLYSKANGCEVRIGSQNTSYVHFTNNANRIYYFDNRIDVSGAVVPYNHNALTLGTSNKYWAGAYISRIYGEADSAIRLVTNYIGGQQANPQTYFGQSVGVKVAMTGVNPDSYWGDTLWINGYYGNDVLPMCALHFSRSGSPYMYISAQNSTATSYGTMYHVWTGFNSNHSSAAWTCSTLNANGRISTTSDIYSAGWVRAGGSNGFYCESYGGGIHMTDSTWVRVYNGKQFYVSSTSSDAIHTAGGINASGRIYAGGHLSTNGGLAVSGIYGGSGASGFNVYAVFQGRSDHGGIEVRASDNTFGIGVHSNDHMYWWWGTSTSTNSSSGKSYIMDYGGGNWSFTGNHYVSGYSTWGSDSRYKTYLGEVTLQLDQIADSPTIYYRWNSKKRDRDGLLHVGGYAQYTEQILPELTHETSNFKTMDYAVCAYVYAVHAARFLRDHLLSDYEWKSDTELRMDALEKENIKLRNRIEQLERRAA
ncbi:tail fiber domain-containing protein [Bacteroides fragilis]